MVARPSAHAAEFGWTRTDWTEQGFRQRTYLLEGGGAHRNFDPGLNSTVERGIHELGGPPRPLRNGLAPTRWRRAIPRHRSWEQRTRTAGWRDVARAAGQRHLSREHLLGIGNADLGCDDLRYP